MQKKETLNSLLKKIFTHYAFGEIKILLSILFMIAGLLMFLLLAGAVLAGGTNRLDEFLLLSLRQPGSYTRPRGPYALIGIMRDITSLGGATVIVLFSVITIIYLLLQKKRRSAMLVLLATLGGGLLENLLKLLIARQRPALAFQLMPEYSHSFPSGHSMMSAVIYLSIAVLIARIQKNRNVRIYVVITGIFMTFIIGISRVYLGVHYPTDVLAGWALGLAWASFVWFVSWYMEYKGKSDETSEQ
ncbi:MAG: phosphatase PAP2 family protein [Ignavibacteriales bacterium]